MEETGSQHQQICAMPWYIEDKEYGDMFSSDDEDYECGSDCELSEESGDGNDRVMEVDKAALGKYKLSLMLCSDDIEI